MPTLNDKPGGAPAVTRSVPALRAALDACAHSPDARIRAVDGWQQTLRATQGYRHLYDEQIARGGWEFYELRPGLWLMIIDMEARCPLPRHHSFCDNLVFSAVISGSVALNVPRQRANCELSDGFCTVYGLREDGIDSVYEPGRSLKWVTVIVDRARITEATGVRREDLPGCVAGFAFDKADLPMRQIPLSGAASLAVSQILECRLSGGFRRAFLTAKTLELTCLLLHALTGNAARHERDASLPEVDFRRVARARALLEGSLGEPPNVPQLASAVGLTRQKLQLGFRLAFGGTVAEIRDKLRIEHALNLVRNSRASMTGIAMETGYGYLGSFTRAFRAAYGTSPTLMRRMAAEESRAARSLAGPAAVDHEALPGDVARRRAGQKPDRRA